MAALIAVIIATGGDEQETAVTAHPARGGITQTTSAYGRIRAVSQVKITPDVSGEIMEIYFDEGDTVTKGALLLKIKQESYQLAITRSEAALGSAVASHEALVCELTLKEMEYRRIQRLREQDAATEQQLQQARVAFESAEARARESEDQTDAARSQLEAARNELSKTLVYSPISGVVTSLRVKPGERVVGTSTMAGTEVMTIADLEVMELVVEVGENDICSLSVGDTATIRPDAAPSCYISGRVHKIAVCSSREGEPGATTDFEVRIAIDPQQAVRLLPGMSASVVIQTGSKNDILTVPLQAVFIRNGYETVWKVDSLQRVSPVQVICGIQDFDSVEIIDGLTEGDQIVTGPFQLITKTLKDGDKIRISDGIKQ